MLDPVERRVDAQRRRAMARRSSDCGSALQPARLLCVLLTATAGNTMVAAYMTSGVTKRSRIALVPTAATLVSDLDAAASYTPDDGNVEEEERSHHIDASRDKIPFFANTIIQIKVEEPHHSKSTAGEEKLHTAQTPTHQQETRQHHRQPVRRRHNKNAAMGDTNFLRKRTSKLLAAVAELNHDEDIRHEKQMISSRGMKVEKKTFHFLFDAWAFSGEEDAAEQAQRLLSCMEELGSTLPALQPDVRSYTKVINAISRSSPSEAAGDEADHLLYTMEELFLNGRISVKPNAYTYTAVMEAHASTGLPRSAKRALELSESMEQQCLGGDPDVRPTARAFNAVIRAYGKIGDAATAQTVFERLDALHAESGVEQPQAFNYNALITAWAHSSEEGSAQRAAKVLEQMEARYKAGVLVAKPTTVSYNAVIDAYARSGEEGATEKAEEVLNRMGHLYESNENRDAKPNSRSFNTVINAWAKSGHPDSCLMAEDLLDVMEDLYEKGNKEVRPDVHSFCSVINAWARSQKEGKAERAYNLYRLMIKLYEDGNDKVRPNVVAVNAVMNACAYTTGDVREQNRAMEIAHTILKSLETSPYGKPDQVTYGTFLKVCAHQMPDSHTRQQIIEVLFRKCCKDGQVGNFVLQQFKSLAEEDLFMSIMGRPSYEVVDIEDLPNEWVCNVVEGRWRRKHVH